MRGSTPQVAWEWVREQGRGQVCSGKEREFDMRSAAGMKWEGRARMPALGTGDAGQATL